jgi:hypothetical protein
LSIVQLIRNMLIACMLVLPMTNATADNSLDIGGQVRARFEVDKKNFDSNAAVKSFFDLRTRLAAHYLIENNTHFYAQLQDSRRLGGRNSTGEDQSGTLNDSRNVDIHQAYIKVEELWQNGIGIQLGRFEVNLGNQRVFGSVGWHNVGRSWEGAHLFLESRRADVSGFWLKRRELNDPLENRDFDIFGINARLKKTNSEFFLFWELDADRFAGATATNIDKLDRFNTGLYLKRSYDPLDLEINVVYQFGRQRAFIDSVFSKQDISAILITFEAGYTLDTDRSARVAAGFDYASGDEDPMDDSYNAYDNLYYTGHKFRGYMDYFIGSNAEGLLDIMARGKIAPSEGWLLSGDLHYFRTDEKYIGLNDEESNHVGVEFDVGITTDKIPGVAFTSGASIFMPGEAFAGEANDPGLWLYTMFTAGF